MFDIDVRELSCRFFAPLLIEVPGDARHLASDSCEWVDTRSVDGHDEHTILHVPSGSLPCPVRRVFAIRYADN